jgi:hypothetical protein
MTDHADKARRYTTTSSNHPNSAAQVYALLAIADAFNNIAKAITTTPSTPAAAPRTPGLCGDTWHTDPDNPCILRTGHALGGFDDGSRSHCDINGETW